MMKQKNFKEIYDSIYNRCGAEMEALRKKCLRKNIFAFGITLLIWVALLSTGLSSSLLPLLFIVFFFTVIALVIIIYKINKNYKLDFKRKIINEIVKKSNPSLSYDCYGGIPSSDYASSGFDKYWDRYFTEDRILGTMEDGSKLTMAQVHTQDRHTTTDSDGHTQTTYVTTFLGLFGYITLKTPTRADFMIVNNSAFSKFNKKRIEMESSEFEKYYDVFSGSKDTGIRQNAMEILTPEAIEELVKIRNMFKRSLNIRVYKEKIYFRIDVGDIFEAPTFKSSVNFDMLHKYFLIIDVPRMIYETLIDNILVMYGDKQARENRTLSNMSDEQKKEYLDKKQKQEESSYFSHK